MQFIFVEFWVTVDFTWYVDMASITDTGISFLVLKLRLIVLYNSTDIFRKNPVF